MKSSLKKFVLEAFKNYFFLGIFIALFLALLITRFSYLETKSVFAWDQLDNAWMAKDIIVDHKLPLVGMQAKGNTGFYIGPFYYYLIVPFYFLTNLDPIASGIIAGVTAIFTFMIIYFVIKSLFNEKIALFALFINVFSSYIMEFDRIQWPVNFVTSISLLVFYSLYKICTGKPKYFLLLALTLGFSLHIHFTSIFYFIFVVFSLPFMHWKKESIKYILLALLIFILLILPIIAQYLTSTSVSATHYIGSSYHGLHLRRFLQILDTGFIEFNSLLKMPYSLLISLTSVLLFIFLYLSEKKNVKRFLVVYLICLWILIPWIAFSTYSGEITNYYFGVTRPVAIMIFSYLLFKVFSINHIFRVLVILFLGIYAVSNWITFIDKGPVSLSKHRKNVNEKILNGEKIEFGLGNPESYLYYIQVERHENKGKNMVK